MLIIDRTQRAWAALSAVVCIVAGGAYYCYASGSANGPTGGSVPGLIFGSLAAAMMIFSGLLAARRRFPAARVGNAQFWLKGHLWIGTLTVPFALFHAGFGLGGRVEILLWILFFAVILSGIWGLLLQQLLPRLMFENLPRETFIEQIPHLCVRFTAESDRLLSEVCGPLEVALTPLDVKQFEPHLRPHFREHLGKNRGLYPNTETDAVHFQTFLKRIYVAVPALTTVPAVEAPRTVAPQPNPPAMTSVAQIKAPEKTPVKPSEFTPETKSESKPSTPQLDLLTSPNPTRAQTAPISAPTASMETSTTPTPNTTPITGATHLAKPDPKAVLAAARAKKAAAEAALAPSEGAAAGPLELPVSEGAVPAKPDAKAMLAALKAKKEAAAQQVASATTDAAPAPPTKPPGQLKTVTEPRANLPSELVTAGNVAPPTATQIHELKLVYLNLIRPQLPLQPVTPAWRECLRRSIMVCQIRPDNQHPNFIPVFDRLFDLCQQRRQFAMIQRFHFWLHGWLLVHIPATVALYLVLVVHAVVALRVIPFGN